MSLQATFSQLTSEVEEHTLALAPAEVLISEFAKGRMILLVDPHGGGQGDLIIPAQMATPDAINFMATHGRGLVCLALTQARAEELNLEFMVRRNAARNRTAFTKSIEARHGITTGISARDRARTISTAIDPSKGPADIVSPGHIFPSLLAKAGFWYAQGIRRLRLIWRALRVSFQQQ